MSVRNAYGVGLAAAALLLACLLFALAPVPPDASAGGELELCPERGNGPIVTSRLEDRHVRVARRMARRHGCVVRVIKRNGEWLPVTADYSSYRANVVVRAGIVTRVDGVY